MDVECAGPHTGSACSTTLSSLLRLQSQQGRVSVQRPSLREAVLTSRLPCVTISEVAWDSCSAARAATAASLVSVIHTTSSSSSCGEAYARFANDHVEAVLRPQGVCGNQHRSIF